MEARLRDMIRVGALESHERPVAVFLFGGPGCGKSSLKPDLARLHDVSSYIDIDQDLVLSYLKDDENSSSLVLRDRARYTCLYPLLNLAAIAREHVIVDRTGRDVRDTAAAIARLRSLHDYHVVLVGVYCERETAWARVKQRAKDDPERAMTRAEFDDVYGNVERVVGKLFCNERYPVKAHELAFVDCSDGTVQPIDPASQPFYGANISRIRHVS